MGPQDKGPAVATDPGLKGQQGHEEPTATGGATQQPRKWQRVLQAFLDRGARGWNRFEAARELRDHVLPTTVSQLEQRGLRIARRDEDVPGHYGPVRCARYWLAPESEARARDLLGHGEASCQAA